MLFYKAQFQILCVNVKLKLYKMKKISMLIICFLIVTTSIFAESTKVELEKAQRAGKSVFLVVTDKLAKDTEALIKTATDASKKDKNTTVIKLDRDDKENAQLISKYRLAGASLPLVLVVASNGVVSGGLNANEASVEKLVSFIPTKNQAEVLLGFENGKAAFIICGKKSAKDKATLEAECKKASAAIGGKVNQVFIDIENKEEANFIALLKPELTKTTVLIFNSKGQYAGMLESTAKSDDIVKTVNKKIGGCAPGSCGSGKKC